MIFLSLLSLNIVILRFAHAQSISPQSLASSLSLATSTSYAFPTATLASSDAAAFIADNWGLSNGRFQDGMQDTAFVEDPFPNKPVPNSSGDNSSPVIQITYPEGSFNNNTGGAQFITLWNTSDGSQFETMMLSYEVAFDPSFNPVLGGKLPGLRGGVSSTGCSGGKEPTGEDCFSARVMWRTNFAGEIYTYIPETTTLCDQSHVICNSDFGISLHRGAFGFSTSQWNRITLVAQMNNPPSASNGGFELYFNDVQAIVQTGLQIRTGSGVVPMGLYFSTFFGGSNSSWATPVTTYSFFRNFQLWGSSSTSNITFSSSTTSSSTTSGGPNPSVSVKTNGQGQNSAGNVGAVLELRWAISAVALSVIPVLLML